MLKIRRPLGRLIFNMGIAIPGKTVFLIETAPWWHLSNPVQRNLTHGPREGSNKGLQVSCSNIIIFHLIVFRYWFLWICSHRKYLWVPTADFKMWLWLDGLNLYKEWSRYLLSGKKYPHTDSKLWFYKGKIDLIICSDSLKEKIDLIEIDLKYRNIFF